MSSLRRKCRDAGRRNAAPAGAAVRRVTAGASRPAVGPRESPPAERTPVQNIHSGAIVRGRLRNLSATQIGGYRTRYCPFRHNA